ncbi:PucR family transcriptional regulator [Pseudolysinimonas sp.]|uniref:PucR family transcriptional regulator n=1 Tax=Pseudolysinimonas sp. TaxID=2680009 RepID=UPI003F7F9CB3
MAATLRSLLAVPRFRLRLVVPPADPAVLDAPLAWVHSSDLGDPTPWLEPGQLLLTDGDQFRGDRVGAVDYIARLQRAEVVGLGFATRIIHDEIPCAVVQAAEKAGFPLLEVADRAPFMAIIRHVADEIAAAQRERLDWLTGAQRAIARAALRVDGLTAILRELESRLDGWVALYDAAGERVAVAVAREIPADLVDAVDEAVGRAVHRRTRSAGRISIGGGEVTLQTLGRPDRLRGVLAIGHPAPLDEAGTDLVASVIAIASVALEQSAALEESRASLRAGILELLLAGSVDAARRSLDRLGVALPAEPVRVVVAAIGEDRALVDELELEAERGRGPFFAAHSDRLVLIAGAGDAGGPGDLETLDAVLRRHRIAAGASGPARLEELSVALAEAERAAAAPTAGATPGLRRFDELTSSGMLGLLGAAGGREAARRLLAPARAREDDGAGLLHAARVWLEHNGAWDPAARALGLHRHTLRARIDLLGAVLGLDLGDFAGRAELWAALQLDEAERGTGRQR